MGVINFFDVGYTSQLWFRRVGTWFKHMKARKLFQPSLVHVLVSAVCRHEATEKKLHVAGNFCQATSALRISCAIKINHLNIGYTMKRRGIRDLDHCRNRLFRSPERVARGRLIRFSR